MIEETCWTLIRAAAAGGADERREFAARYLDVVRRYLDARWRGSAMQGDVADAVQEVFVACLREGGALSRAAPGRGSGFRAFLLGVAQNIALHWERRRRRHRTESLVCEPAADDSSLSRVYDRAYARAIMREAAERMADRAASRGPEAVRRVELLRRRFEDGMAVREIAAEWKVEAMELHRDSVKAGREFKAVLKEVVGLTERCAPEHLERECDRLLKLLR